MGTHTIVFDTNEHKIGNISLTYTTLTEVDIVDAIGTYKLYVMYTGVTKETMTRYNSTIVTLTIE